MAGNRHSGRKHKPKELKVLEGTFRKDRGGDAPSVSGGFPVAPDCLNEAEQRLWETFPRVAWIGASDVLAVHAAVSIYERILRNQQRQQDFPDKAWKLINAEAALWGRLLSILGSLGLTPADRGKMTAPKVNDQQDKWAGIL